MAIATGLTSALGIRHPVLLAPMAGVSGGTLAAAVSRAGGLGLIGGGYGDPAWIEREFAAAGDARVGVGFILWALERQPGLLDSTLEREPAAVMLSFGDAARFAPRVRAAGVPLIVQVQTVAGAQAALDAGADVLVAQGTEAGGHGGQRATLPLVPAVVDIAGRVPVVAAGGIADGRGLAAALMLGAQGVLCGTVFFTCTEALAHPAAKAAALSATGDTTLRSSVFDIARGLDWPADWNLRTLRNAFATRWHGAEAALRAEGAVLHARYARAAAEGEVETAAVIVGEAVDMLRAERPAAEVLADIVAGAEARLATTSALLAP